MSTQVPQQKLNVRVREGYPEDAPLIFSSWLKSFKDKGLSKLVVREVYFSEQHKLIERLLKTAKTLIACDPKDAASIYGWLCYEEVEGVFVLHYAYTKNSFRSLGIFEALLKETGHDTKNASLYTHWTPNAASMEQKFNMLYHPYILLNYNKGQSNE